jgi:hypothetical protein
MSTFTPGVPQALFATRMALTPGGHHYAVSHDGQRFLIATAVEGAHSVPINDVLNWDAALKK